MWRRIERHQKERGSAWTTLEEPLDLAGVLRREGQRFDLMLVDCLTLWLSNVLLSGRDAAEELSKLEAVLEDWNGPPLLLITNEVGCGIVPENALGRRYRDLAGEMNQSIARRAVEVYWMVFGVPVRVKPER
jgi:adenosylcobinamide kinase/adenosylcobinamide-phosphate guanylyltransferase